MIFTTAITAEHFVAFYVLGNIAKITITTGLLPPFFGAVIWVLWKGFYCGSKAHFNIRWTSLAEAALSLDGTADVSFTKAVPAPLGRWSHQFSCCEHFKITHCRIRFFKKENVINKMKNILKVDLTNELVLINHGASSNQVWVTDTV